MRSIAGLVGDYSLAFGILLGIVCLLRYLLAPLKTSSTKSDVKPFQRRFLLGYLVMKTGDWIQGPYVFALYEHYGLSIEEIAKLFLVAYISSMISSPFVGAVADKFGRKRSCLSYGVFSTLSCLCILSQSTSILYVGRIFSGIGSSILHSSFESWMVKQHHSLGYPREDLKWTFGLLNAGNGIVAIIAGVSASLLVTMSNRLAPFKAAIVLFGFGFVFISIRWEENFGDETIDLQQTLSNAVSAFRKPAIVLLGSIQSLFESSMYIFVFLWTPALEPIQSSSAYDQHGWIFACFMVAITIGSTLFKLSLQYGISSKASFPIALVCSSLCMSVPVVFTNRTARFIAFVVFECCCGFYFPSIGSLKSRLIGEAQRTTITSMFRIPLNLIVALVLTNMGNLSQVTVFCIIIGCLLAASSLSMLIPTQILLYSPIPTSKRSTEL